MRSPGLPSAPRAALVLLALGSPLFWAMPARAAAPKDAQTEKAITQAMDVDFLETKFDQAEKRLRTAIDACAADKCTPSVKARAFVALGVVLAGGKKQLEDAREAFVEALTLDKAAKPDEDMSSAEVKYTYEQARKQLKLDGPAAGGSSTGQPAPSGQGLTHTAPTEQRIDTPLPLYVRLAPELLEDAKKVTVTYLSPGVSDWKTLVMKKVGEQGFGINVPCGDVTKEGELKYHITITDADGAIVTGTGSRALPLVTVIKARIEGNPPSWPGFAPPELCVKVESGPKQCLDDNQCNAGFSCVGGECTKKTEGSGGEEPKDTGPRKNWVSFTVAPDISIFSGKDVCAVDVQQRDHFVCVREDGSRYLGVPTAGVANDVKAGLALSTIRIMAGYDRLFMNNLLAGVRLGFAFRTSSDDDASFLPVHAELRGSYYLGKDPFVGLGARPFVFAAAGLAQIDTPVNVEVLEDGGACGATNPGDQNSPCTRPSSDLSGGVIEPRIQSLKAYKQAGQGFLALGGGIQYAPLERVAISVGVRANVTLPVVTFVLTPEVGATVGF